MSGSYVLLFRRCRGGVSFPLAILLLVLASVRSVRAISIFFVVRFVSRVIQVIEATPTVMLEQSSAPFDAFIGPSTVENFLSRFLSPNLNESTSLFTVWIDQYDLGRRDLAAYLRSVALQSRG